MRLIFIAMMVFVQTAFADVLPQPDHIVIVIEENKSFNQIVGNPAAPYINSLLQHGVLFTNSRGITHPSQPNYLALFSGSTHNITNDACLLELSGDNLASNLFTKNFSFVSYSETLPETAYLGCIAGSYARKHNPLSNWLALAKFNQPFVEFPQDFAKLPTVALVVPNLLNDMHDGSIAQGDTWLAQNIGRYAQWALTHNSLLIVTWDEDNGTVDNQIATIFFGAVVNPGKSSQQINHYTVLRTVSDIYGLPLPGLSASEKSISGIWKSSTK